jgi:hypothetical protein
MPATGYSLFYTTTDTTELMKLCPLYYGAPIKDPAPFPADPKNVTPAEQDLIGKQKLCLYRSDYENQQMQ